MPSPPRVLLVEDHEVNRLILVNVIKRLGYRVDVATNGIEAIIAAQNAPYNVILMDLEMPHMDGYDAARAIRRADTRALQPTCPIIALTAHSDPGMRVRCAAAGITGHMAKPVDRAELARTLARYCGSPRPSAIESGPPAASLLAGDRSGVDLAALVDELGGDRPAAREILSKFFALAREKIPTLQIAIAQRQAEECRQISHAMKGAAAAVHARAIAEQAAQVERAAIAGAFDEAALLLEAIVARVASLETSVREQF